MLDSDPPSSPSHDRWSRLRRLPLGLIITVAGLAGGILLAVSGRVPPSWNLDLGSGSTVLVPGLGSFPRLRVLHRWGPNPRARRIVDIRADIAVSYGQAGSVPILRVNGEDAPSLMGEAQVEHVTDMRLSADGATLLTLGSAGWGVEDGAFHPSPLVIVDIADPLRPITVSQVTLEADRTILLPWGDYMLVGEGRSDPTPLPGGLRVIELRGAAAGHELGRLEGEIMNLAVEGDRAYSVRACGGKSPPLPTREFGRDPQGQLSYPPPMVVESDPAFPTCVAVIDLSDPTRPTLVSEAELPWPTFPSAIATSGGFVYLLDYDGIMVVDARGPGKPVVSSERFGQGLDRPMRMDNFDPGGRQDLVANGSILYLGDHTTIVAFDLSDPARPSAAAAFQLGRKGYLHRLILDGDRLFVATGEDNFSVDHEGWDLWMIDAPSDPADLPQLEAASR